MSNQPRSLLDLLAAEREINANHVRFFEIADAFEHHRFVECFTPDAFIEYTIMPGPPQRFHSAHEFAAFMSAGGQRGQQAVAHVAGQHVVRWHDDRPHLSGYATVWHWTATHDHAGRHRPADWTTIGRIEDDYQNLDGRWLISRRSVSRAAGLIATGAI
ncbi:nuclear transport factor 2 family protein [Gordonia sp. ABSL11-1]|uniref:nuclear transport factor 2 family protein n=1 Tax=Gordonia sp. ABSL11-1 TaxID=3053924 RepID=UPI00257489A0|nr:nuclear transport factor 2 family protein [Gordonia sp. ABSL11-1]MDL9945623.1 nuclear transport factor 2 family protein [Gordonia sp. ABSL11-1]